MYKTLCVAVLLLPTFVLAQGSKPADASPTTPIGPPIVAHGKLLNQNTPLPSTTIFTPTQDGLYRLSVYLTITRADSSSNSQWGFNVDWVDDVGVQEANFLLLGYGNVSGQFFVYQSFRAGGTAMPFEAKAGMPITYNVTQIGGPDNSSYSLYYTLERLE